MASNLTIEPGDFDRIRKDAGHETADFLYTLWLAMNSEARDRRAGIRLATSRASWGTKVHAPAANQDNLKHDDVVWQRFDGSTAVNVTGFRASVDGTLLIALVLGSATITMKHNVTSENKNRLLNQTGADIAVATNQAIAYVYQNARWRHVSLL